MLMGKLIYLSHTKPGIAHNSVEHDRMKHVEIDRHFIKEKLETRVIIFLFVKSENQLADVSQKQ